MSEPVVIGNRHVLVGIDPAKTGDRSVVSIVCTLCDEAEELSAVASLDDFREKTTTFAGKHWDCRYGKRPAYAADDRSSRSGAEPLPTRVERKRREHVPHREKEHLFVEQGDPEA